MTSPLDIPDENNITWLKNGTEYDESKVSKPSLTMLEKNHFIQFPCNLLRYTNEHRIFALSRDRAP